jgi:Fe-S-cluster containining protein
MIKAFSELHRIYRGFEAADMMLQQSIGVSTCVSGCGKCCMNNVPYWRTIEAINTVSMLLGTGKLGNAVKVAEGWLLEHHKEAVTYEGRPIGMASPRIHDEWLALRITPCPFLQENKQCLIHLVRPIACRAFAVTHDGMPTCNRPPGKGETLTQHSYIIPNKLRTAVNTFWSDCESRKPEWIVGSFVPTLLYRAAEPEKFKKMILDNQIASAKIIGVNYEVSLMWQPQLDQLRAGISPDLVSEMA